MSNKVRVFALGGMDEDGKNLYVVEINNDIFVFEAGMKYPDVKNAGIDMVIPDASYLFDNKERIKGYFISHGHDDIMGSLPYIIQKAPAPVYCSINTSYMINLTTHKFKQDVNYDYRFVKSGDCVNVNGHEVYCFATTHSARDSLGFAIETGNGLVVYTGDFLFDYESLPQYRTDVNLLARLGDKKVLLLMCESIACNKAGHTSPYHKMSNVIEPVFSNNPDGRIYISIYYQNVFGVREVLDLAAKYKRKVYIYGDDFKTMLKNTFDDNLKQILLRNTISDADIGKPGNDNFVVLIGGQGQEVFDALEKMTIGELPKFQIKSGDNVIIASRPVPGIEVYSTKVIDEIYKTGAQILQTKKEGVISMHARAEDIKMMISIFKPKYYLPVKGQYQNLIANANIALSMNLGYNYGNVFILDNGIPAEFIDGQFVGTGDQLQLNDVMIDGLIVGEQVCDVIQDRERLGDQGFVVLGISVDSESKTIVGGPDIQMRGLIYLKDSDSELIKALATQFDSMVSDMLNEGKIDDPVALKNVEDKLVFIVKGFTGKTPLILPIITDIKK